MSFNNIMIAGGSGNLGSAILRELLSSSDPTFNVTALTHSKSTTAASLAMTFGLPSTASHRLNVVWVDYGNQENLIEALSGAEVVIATLAGHVALQIDPLLLEASRKAGVRRYIPSQYALDVLHPTAVGLFTDGWPNAFSLALARRYMALGEENGPISYTTVLPSMFIDVFLETGLWGAYDIPHRKAVVVDDGTQFLTVCSTEFIAAAIIAILKLPEDATKNKRIPIAETRTTAVELIETIEEVFGFKMDVEYKPSGEFLRERQDALAKKDFRTAHIKSTLKLGGDGSGAADLIEGLAFDANGTFVFPRRNVKDLVLQVKARMRL
ncbi:hypothetical protein GGI35DRAFT_487228, partial [Trichoderma velutinum]